MFCPRCGFKNESSDRFCRKCGNIISYSTSNANSVRSQQIYVNSENIKKYGSGANNYNRKTGYFNRHFPNIPGIIVSILLFISPHLPALVKIGSNSSYSYSGKNAFESVSLVDFYYGYYIVMIATIGVIMAMLDVNIGIILSGIGGAVVFFLVIKDLKKALNLFDNSNAANNIGYGIGFWSVIVLSVLLMLCAVYGYVRRN